MAIQTRRGFVKKMVLAAMFMAIGLILPFFTGQIPKIGNLLLPMHLPILLCGFLCGWPYGLVVGFLTPLVRSLLFGMPPLYPVAVSMAFELAAYGLITGLLYRRLPQKLGFVYVDLVAAMLGGRVVLAGANLVLYGLQGSAYTMQMFLAGAFLDAIPGIVLQLVILPPLVQLIQKNKVIREYA